MILMCTETPPKYDLQNEQTWADLLNVIKPYVRHFVYSSRVTSWRGQEEDIIKDIVQEVSRRILERAQQAEQLAAPPINSLKSISLMIARNYCIDMLRRDRRLQRISSDHDFFEGNSSSEELISPFETAIELASQEELFTRLAHEIARFPEKRRRALLIDLANRMCFDEELTPLQKAFLAEGIDLRALQLTLSEDSAELAKHSSLLSLAYKQVAKVMGGFLV